MKEKVLKKVTINDIKKIHIFSHTDLDGIGSGLILEKLFPKAESKTIYCNYSKMDENIAKFERNNYGDVVDLIFIVDLAFENKELAEKLNEKYSEKLVLLDHHLTAKFMNNYCWANVESETNNKLASATSLIVDWAKESQILNQLEEETIKTIEFFSETVRSYDTWDWSKTGNQLAHDLNELFYLKGSKSFAQEFRESNLSLDLTEKDYAMLEALKLRYNQYLKGKKSQIKKTSLTNIEGTEFTVGIVYTDINMSELGNDLGAEFPELDVIILINMNKRTVSYRTCKETIDTTLLARKFGGGGHKKASGSELTKEFLLEIIEKTEKN